MPCLPSRFWYCFQPLIFLGLRVCLHSMCVGGHMTSLWVFTASFSLSASLSLFLTWTPSYWIRALPNDLNLFTSSKSLFADKVTLPDRRG